MKARLADEAEPIVLRPGLYLAPSASGKSYGAKHGRWLDGDEIVAAAVGWPKVPKWWQTDDRQDVHYVNTVALHRYMADHPTAVILFNGYIDGAAVRLYQPAAKPINGVLVPTADWIMRNFATHPHAGKHRGEEEFRADVERNASSLIALAFYFGVPAYAGVRVNEFFKLSETT